MQKSVALMLAMTSGLLLHMTATASAQGTSTNLYAANAPPNGTVSPYLNLQTNSDGISNYQSLVRPMLNNREALASQATARERSRFGVRPVSRSSTPAAAAPEANARDSQRRFLNYSHYFGGVR